MSRLETPLLEKQIELDERFRYGWREARRRLPDGSYTLLRLPLTLYDVLHPQECDKIMNNSRHDVECEYLSTVLRDRYRHDPSVLVLHDTGVYWDTPGLEHHSPDLTVIFHIDHPQQTWSSFHVAAEGVKPAVIIEVVTPRYRDVDVVTKFDQYHRAEVPWYGIVDRLHEDDPPTVVVYRWTADKYTPVEPDVAGLVLLEPLGLKLGVVEERIALFDGDTGQELGDYSAIKAALEAERTARQDAEEARQEAEEARQKAEEARQEAEELAKSEAARANLAETPAAEAERQAAELQQHLRDIEEQLRHRNGPNGSAPKA